MYTKIDHAVEEDTRKVLGIMNWKRRIQDRLEWKGLIKEATILYWSVVP